MELTIKIDDNKKTYQMFLDFLKSLKITDIAQENSKTKKSNFKSLKEFRLHAGLWKDRNITIEQIREKHGPSENSSLRYECCH